MRRDEYRARLGVTDPFEEYKRRKKELDEGRGVLTPEEYDLRHKRLQGDALSSAMSDAQDVQPVGAMKAGSAAAYSMAVRAELDSGKTQAVQEALTKLTNIDLALQRLADAAHRDPTRRDES